MKNNLFTIILLVVILTIMATLNIGCGGSGGEGSALVLDPQETYFLTWVETFRTGNVDEEVRRFGAWLKSRPIMNGQEYDLWPVSPDFDYERVQTQNGYGRLSVEVLHRLGHSGFVMIRIDHPVEYIDQYQYFNEQKWMIVVTDKFHYVTKKDTQTLPRQMTWEEIVTLLRPDWTGYKVFSRHLNILGEGTRPIEK